MFFSGRARHNRDLKIFPLRQCRRSLPASARATRGRAKSVRASEISAGTFVAEGIEPVGKRYQSVGVERVVLYVLDIVTGNGTAYAVALPQNIIYFHGDSGVFPFEELVGGLGVP